MTVLWKKRARPGLVGREVRGRRGRRECYVFDECFAASQRGTRQDGITCLEAHRRHAVRLGRVHRGQDPQPADRQVGRRGRVPAGPVRLQPGRGNARINGNSPPSATGSYAPANGFAAVKFDVDLDGKMFYPCPKGT